MWYLCLDHVDPAGPQLPHTVVDVHHSLSLRHVQHDVHHHEAAGASRARTVNILGQVYMILYTVKYSRVSTTMKQHVRPAPALHYVKYT